MSSKIFLIPNEDKNVKLVEESNGLRMYYVLSCPKDFPLVSFISKNKAYYRTNVFIPYDAHMSQRINFAYMWLKSRTMLSLANFKKFQLENKIEQLITLTETYDKFKV